MTLVEGFAYAQSLGRSLIVLYVLMSHRARHFLFSNLTLLPVMIRSLLSLILALAFSAGASAQTTPKTTKTTEHTKAAMHRPARTSLTSTSRMSKLPISTKGQTQSIYAAPGQPIVVEGKVGPYDGPAAGRHTTKRSTTLSPR